jgi:hypothetical protein
MEATMSEYRELDPYRFSRLSGSEYGDTGSIRGLLAAIVAIILFFVVIAMFSPGLDVSATGENADVSQPRVENAAPQPVN